MMGILNDIIQHSIEHHRRRFMETALRPNAFVAWAFKREERMLNHYYDMSIELDMIHEYMPEDRIYRG